MGMDDLLAQLLNDMKAYADVDYTAEQDPVIENMISDAVEEVCNEMHPWAYTSDAEHDAIKLRALQQYYSTVRRIAAYHYDKWGIEGTTNYSESGRQVTYASGTTPPQYLRNVVPIARVV